MIYEHLILLLFLFSSQNGVNSNIIYDARLTNGYYGTVEVLTYRGWRPLCNYYYWSSSQHRVLCHQYGLEYSSSSTTRVQSSSNSLAYSISCSGTESELSQCPYHFSRELSSCSSYGLVTISCVPCSNGTVRLKASIVPEAGTVEHCIDGIWKAICDSNWDYKDAYVICRQLGLPATDVVQYLDSTFGRHKYQSQLSFSCFGNESSLANCQSSTSSSCDENDAAGVHCRGEIITEQCNMDGQVRLAGGKSDYEGRVEICSNGVWGTVYDGGWDVREATVVCGQLGFPISSSRAEPLSLSSGRYGMGTGPILYAYLSCTGTEPTLAECSTYRSFSFGVSHSSDAGVKCHARSNCANGDVRLVNGTTRYEGRVEICYDGVWGSVCDNSYNEWDDWDAAIVCLQLGFQGTNATAISNSFFGDGDGPYHLSSLGCSGEERTLLDCFYTNESSRSLSSRCTSGNDAGVRCDASVCNHGDTRLYGGYVSAGNIGVAEVCINGKWADICDDVNRASVSTIFCRQLIGDQSLSFGSYYFPGVSRRNTGNITLYNITCNALSRHLTDDCSFNTVSGYSTAGCHLREELVVGCYEQSSCTEGDLRLVGGNSSLEGRVEVCAQGMWGALYAYYLYPWSVNDARVVCRQLGYPWNWALGDISGLFGRGKNRIIAGSFRCTGDEKHLLECRHNTITLSDYASYQSETTAGVICQGNTSTAIECENGEVRLIDGPTEMEGRVEVCVSGYWSIACDSYWTGISQAKLICRQLKLPTHWVDYISGSPFGSNYQLPIVGLSCGSGANNVSECQTYTEIINCNHKQTMGVICRDLEYNKVIVSVSPAQESYEMGSQVTLKCIAPRIYGNFILPKFYYCWHTTSLGNFHDTNSSTGSTTYSYTIPTTHTHPKSEDYHCDIYHNGQLLGSGKTTITIKGILQSSNSNRLKIHPQEILTLQVETLNINIIRLLVELTWYHNRSVIVPSHDERVTISDNNKTLTITNFTSEDAGVYTVQFNQLLIYPYNKVCTDDLISFVREYPLLKPVTFCVNLDESDCNSMEMQSRLSREISVKAKEVAIQGTINAITLEANSMTNSIEETRHSMFFWYLRGRRVISGLTTLQKRHQSLSQNMYIQLFNVTYEMTGRYDVVLVLDLYTYFTDLGCLQYYDHFVSNYEEVPRYLPLANTYADVGYYRALAFNLDSNKRLVARNDHEGATLTCQASIEFPPFSSLSLIKNGRILSSTVNGSLQITTKEVDGNPFGLYSCQLNTSAAGIKFQRSYLLKEQANLRVVFDIKSSNICSNSEMAIKLIEEKLIQKIKRECRCSFRRDGFQSSTINCENHGELTYTTTLEYSNEEGSETASIITKRIVSQVPFSMAVGGTQLTVTSACTDCEIPTTKPASLSPAAGGVTKPASLSPAAGGGLFIGGFLAAVLITIILVIIVVLAVKKCAKSEDKPARRIEVKTDPLRYASAGAAHQDVSLKGAAEEYMTPQPKQPSIYQAMELQDQPNQYETMQMGDQPIYEETF